MQYNVDGDFDTMGCSGAPVIDAAGRLAGVNVAHLHEQTIPGVKQLILIDAVDVLSAVKLPPDVKAVQAAHSLSATTSPAQSASDTDAKRSKRAACGTAFYQ